MSVSVKHRFEKELDSSFFKMAALVHPKFKLNWVDDSKQEEHISIARVELSTYRTPYNLCSSEQGKCLASHSAYVLLLCLTSTE